jgi:hypothetical protein
MFICIMGSVATGMSPVEFLIIGTCVSIAAIFVIGFTLAGIVIIVQLFLIARSDHSKSFKRVIIEDYNWKEILKSYLKLLQSLMEVIIEDWNAGPATAIENKLLLLGRSVKELISPAARKAATEPLKAAASAQSAVASTTTATASSKTRPAASKRNKKKKAKKDKHDRVKTAEELLQEELDEMIGR